MATLLLRLPHGLGDVTQFTVVLKHLRQYRPDWEIDVCCGIGKHTAVSHLCRRVFHDKEAQPDSSRYTSDCPLGWYENYCRYTDRPNSKITNCLREVFDLDWDAGLSRYDIFMPGWACERARNYLKSIGCTDRGDGRYNAVAIHYQGNTSAEKKNLHLHEAMNLCETARKAGRIPIILDWDNRSPLINQRTVFCPNVHSNDIWGNIGTGDACVLAALIEHCEAFIGIDSGPGKVASATNTPSLICWRKHHPLQFHDPAANTEHLIPYEWEQMAPLSGDQKMAAFFRSHYNYGCYDNELDCSPAACFWLEHRLGRQRKMEPAEVTLEMAHGFWCNASMKDKDYVVIKDVLLEDAYRTRLIGERAPDEIVVDVGAHIGVFSTLWHKRNPTARIVAVEACPENLPALRANVGDFAQIVEAACTYEPGPLYLLNAIGPWCRSTGGSRVVDEKTLEGCWEVQYWHDRRPLQLMNLDELMTRLELPCIDILKLDCEGSEFSILEHAPLDRIGFIFMESHDASRWRDLWERRFKDWDVGHMSANGDFENWHLRNPNFRR